MDRGRLYVGRVYRFTVECFDSSGNVVAQSSAPSFVVVKNGTPTLDSVTAVNRDSDGKHYDCSYDPSGEVETDHFEIRVTVSIASVNYKRPSEHFDVIAIERGTDSAYTGTPPTAGAIASQVRTELTTELGRIDANVSSRLASASYTAPDDKSLLVSTTIATLASQTSFTLTAGSSDNNAYRNCFAIITDASTAVQKSVRKITSYVSGVVTLESAPDFTIAASDNIAIVSRLADTEISVAPFTSQTEERVAGSTIKIFVGELDPITVYDCKDANGDAITIPADATLYIAHNKSNIATITGLTISGNDFTFTPTAEVVKVERTLSWSLRDGTKVLAHGAAIVSYTAWN